MRKLMALAVLACGFLFAADVTGSWAAKVETGAGSGTPTFSLKQDGSKLTGHYSGQLGEAELTGTLKGEDIEFSIKLQVNGEDVAVTYKGKVTGADKMSGTVQFGSLGEGTWDATKK